MFARQVGGGMVVAVAKDPIVSYTDSNTANTLYHWYQTSNKKIAIEPQPKKISTNLKNCYKLQVQNKTVQKHWMDFFSEEG